MNKKDMDRLVTIRTAIDEFIAAVDGTRPIRWGSSEYHQKSSILVKLGYALVTKSKLEHGGHQLKKKAEPIGQAYFTSPISKWANLYVLGLQTERTHKWYDLYSTGNALLEGTYQFRRQEYGNQISVSELQKIEVIKILATQIKVLGGRPVELEGGE